MQEKVHKISETKRILIVGNANGVYGKGDFITLLSNNKPFARALVAKADQQMGGIKVVKIYSLEMWNQFVTQSNQSKDSTVMIFKGDDSQLGKGALALNEKDSKAPRIENDSDLFNNTLLINDDDVVDEKGKRVIKTDNILSFEFGYVNAPGNGGDDQRYSHFMGGWAYQVLDNIWAEAMVGRSIMAGYPVDGIDTTLWTVTLRGRYTFEVPFYTYIQPYAGVQFSRGSSPEAGDPDATRGPGEPTAGEEVTLAEAVDKNSLIIGVSILKRLVPGWFAKFDLGTDVLAGGLALEF